MVFAHRLDMGVFFLWMVFAHRLDMGVFFLWMVFVHRLDMGVFFLWMIFVHRLVNSVFCNDHLTHLFSTDCRAMWGRLYREGLVCEIYRQRSRDNPKTRTRYSNIPDMQNLTWVVISYQLLSNKFQNMHINCAFCELNNNFLDEFNNSSLKWLENERKIRC